MQKICLAVFVALLSPLTSLAACPKNKKEWHAKGTRIFLERVAEQNLDGFDLAKFSAKNGKSTTSSAFPFKEGKRELVLMQAKDNDTSLFLTGIMRCDPETKEPKLLSLTWVRGEKSGLVKLKKP